MRETSAWSWNCGLWGGVRVHVHASLLVFLVLIFFVVGHLRPPADFTVNGLIAAGVLVVALLLHELGHLVATWLLGGTVDLIVLGPLGGLHWTNLPRVPHREVAAALAGPMGNLVGMLACGPSLLMADVSLGDILLHPLFPGGMFAGSPWLVAVKMLFWFNWLLLLVNLIPAVPLDGGRALRSMLWPVMGYRGAVRTVSRTGMLVSLILCLAAIWSYDGSDMHLVSPWLPLVLMAIFLYFSARQELQRTDDDEAEEDLLGYDFSQGYTSLERGASQRRRSAIGPLRRWLLQRREDKQRRLREIEIEEERRVDEVLVRVKQLGVDALSPEERALLHRVSARYRARSQP
jgi:Zn-dependent protease